MDNFGEDYKQLYSWETDMFFQTEEFASLGFEQPTLSGCYDSSSPDGTGSGSSASNTKNIVSERNRRRKLNERLFSLRAAVPTISKMDKASIVKDAINYIQVLQEEERMIQSEITELERRRLNRESRPKKKKTMMMSCSDTRCRSYSPRITHCGSLPRIEDVELRFTFVGNNTAAVNLTCSKIAGAMIELCELFESLKYKIVTTHISVFAGTLFKTVLVEVNEDEMELLRVSLETGIANLNSLQSTMSC